jgi:hypothetical protein
LPPRSALSDGDRLPDHIEALAGIGQLALVAFIERQPNDF